jgi:hypothetical protein
MDRLNRSTLSLVLGVVGLGVTLPILKIFVCSDATVCTERNTKFSLLFHSIEKWLIVLHISSLCVNVFRADSQQNVRRRTF